ncbi:hypothetical protein IKG38_03285 [Candidatus Saccharibacteria bacterium]|nr:hypothetical protein [Candidatus Saccharibacteria bacterium]
MGNSLSTSLSGMTPTGAAFLGGIVGSTMIFFFVATLIIYILFIIASWKIFVKAGEKGWKSLIPIYNLYIMFKIVKMKSWFWYLIFMSICASIMMVFDGYNLGTMTEEQIMNYNYINHPMTLIAIVMISIINLVAAIIYVYRLAKVFGKGIGFAILTFFFPNICWLILGFGKAKYDRKNLKKN